MIKWIGEIVLWHVSVGMITVSILLMVYLLIEMIFVKATGMLG